MVCKPAYGSHSQVQVFGTGISSATVSQYNLKLCYIRRDPKCCRRSGRKTNVVSYGVYIIAYYDQMCK